MEPSNFEEENALNIVEFARLNLGEDKAESEFDELEKYFIPTPTYLNASSKFRRKTYYIGQRGAGKSALFKRLADDFGRNAKDIIIKVTPDDFSYEKFSNLEHNYSNMRSVYGYVWHYTLVTEMFRHAVEFYRDRPYLKTNRNNVEKLRQYLERRNALGSEGFLGTFLTYFGEFTSNKNFNEALKVGSTGRSKDFIQLSELSELAEELRALRGITEAHQLYLFIDELDRGWDNSKEATNFIHGLFYSVRKIKELHNVTIFVSLRSDMYNDLSSILPDPEKMRGEIERFSWTPGMLRELISERILVSYEMTGDTGSSLNPISSVFEDGVLDYIIGHTLHRPREVIQFCKEVISRANAEYHFADKTKKMFGKIDLPTVKLVEPEFSYFRLQDMCKEYEHQYPDLYLFLSSFANSKKYYTMREFEEKLEDVMLKTIDKLGAHSWLGINFTTSKLTEILFEIGFIKLYSERYQKYLASYEGMFINTGSVTKLRIHEVFTAALQCF